MYNFTKYTRIETEEEFHETMDKIPDYVIEEKEVSIIASHSVWVKARRGRLALSRSKDI